MRTLIIGALAAVLLVGSGGVMAQDAPQASVPETQGSVGNAEIVKALYDAFGRGDVPAVLSMLDPAIEWNEAENFLYAEGNPYRGPQAVADGVFKRIVSDVDNFAVLPERFTVGTDTVVVEGRYRGTMKATGTPVDAQFAHVWELRDGKIVGFQQYTDTKQWAEAAGS